MADEGFWAVLAKEGKAAWDALRNMGPVVEINGVYHLTRSEDVLAALRNTEVFSSGRRPRTRAFDVVALPAVPSWFDAPDLTRYREILQPLFSSTVMKELSPALATQAAQLVDAVADCGECDAMTAVAVPYPMQAFLTLWGLPLDDRDKLCGWKNTILAPAPEPGPYLAAVFDLFGYMAAAIEERRENPSIPGLLSHLPINLWQSEAIGVSVLTFLGGIGPVAAAIGIALLALACDPQLRCLLRTDPEQVKVFADEIIRLEAPVSGISRVSTQDVTIGGVTIPAGSTVALRVGAINREEGDDICLRAGQIVPHKHWSFGAGPHRCLGSYLARMQLSLVVNEWLRRIPDFEIQAGYSPPLYDIRLSGWRVPADHPAVAVGTIDNPGGAARSTI